MKSVLAAAIREVIMFDSAAECDAYIAKQRGSYQIIERYELAYEKPSGKVLLTINKQYNNTPLLEDLDADEAVTA